MWKLCVGLVILTLPQMASAQVAPESLLPAKSQLYFHFEGMEKHKKNYEKTAFAKMMAGDMGTFFNGLFDYVGKQMKDNLKDEINPEQAQLVRDHAFGMFKNLAQHGVVFGAEVRSVQPLDMQATLVFPNGAGDKKSLVSLINLAPKFDKKTEIKELKQGGKTIRYTQAEEVYLMWWSEGKHAVLTVSSHSPEKLLARMKEEKGKFMMGKFYNQVKQFDEFPSWCYGYVDLRSITVMLNEFNLDIGKVIDQIGLSSASGITFNEGFSGPAQRSVFQIHLDGQRKGIFRLANKKSFTLADLPPMPDDLTAFAASNINLGEVYNVTMEMVESIVAIASPNDVGQATQAIQGFEQASGISLQKDLFAHMGDLVVGYAAWPEGILGTGQITLIKTKDADKLEKTLVDINRFAQNQFAGIVELKEAKYRGVTIYSLHSPIAGTGAVSWAVHKGWLAVAAYPQPIKGFILRTKGDLPSWKVAPAVKEHFENMPNKITGITYHDPRPSMKVILSVTPLLMAYGNVAIAELGKLDPNAKTPEPFDLQLIPNAYEATQHLFPNVTVSTDQGNVIRIEARVSIGLPF